MQASRDPLPRLLDASRTLVVALAGQRRNPKVSSLQLVYNVYKEFCDAFEPIHFGGMRMHDRMRESKATEKLWSAAHVLWSMGFSQTFTAKEMVCGGYGEGYTPKKPLDVNRYMVDSLATALEPFLVTA